MIYSLSFCTLILLSIGNIISRDSTKNIYIWNIFPQKNSKTTNRTKCTHTHTHTAHTGSRLYDSDWKLCFCCALAGAMCGITINWIVLRPIPRSNAIIAHNFYIIFRSHSLPFVLCIGIERGSNNSISPLLSFHFYRCVVASWLSFTVFATDQTKWLISSRQ